MKRVSILLAAIVTVMFVSTSAAMAEGSIVKGNKVKVYNKGKHVELVYLSDNAVEVEIEVADIDGKVVYQGNTSSRKGFVLPFDMSMLPAGEYTFSVKEGDYMSVGTAKTTVTIADGSKIDVIRTLDAKGFVVTSTEEIPTDLNLYLYNAKGELMYKGEFESDKVIEDKYNLENIGMDELKVVITEEDVVLKSVYIKF